jgi:hypothetical protein
MRVMIWYPDDSHAVWEMPMVPRTGDRVETPNAEYGVRDVLWTLQPDRPTDAPVTVFLR